MQPVPATMLTFRPTMRAWPWGGAGAGGADRATIPMRLKIRTVTKRTPSERRDNISPSQSPRRRTKAGRAPLVRSMKKLPHFGSILGLRGRNVNDNLEKDFMDLISGRIVSMGLKDERTWIRRNSRIFAGFSPG